MIIRILSEGQFEISESNVDSLNALDTQLTSALDAQPGADAGDWHGALADLLAFVREHGAPLADEDLRPSDAVLPEEDATVEDVRALLTGEGLIPG